MPKQTKTNAISLMLLIAAALISYPAVGYAEYTVKELHGNYKQGGDESKRKETLIELSKTQPKTSDDVSELRSIFSKKDYDENLFDAAIESLKKIRDKSLENDLIEILKDEKTFADKSSRKDYQGKTEGERKRREMNIMFVMGKLGQMKSQAAVPILKNYLDFPGFNYYASQALAMIGDTSASEQIREKAYEGEDLNYGGQGSEEALTIIRDLEDKSKKDKWPKIAKQIIHIRGRNAKPYLKKLFNHEKTYVRWEAADKFRAMVDESDVPSIIEMSKNQDSIIRVEAIHAMQNLKNIEFGDELIAMLSDPAYNVRRTAAKAVGYKKISRAVPYLEKALKDAEQRVNSHSTGSNDYNNELRVCQESYIALYILTGKKYDYKGKTSIIEWKAERQKEHPTIY